MESKYAKYSPGVHKLVHHLGHLKAMVDGAGVAPIHVSVWPTVRCQCRCTYCCCRNEANRENGDLDPREFLGAVDVLARRGTKAIEFSGGGEPLLWPHLPAVASYIREKGIKLSLITNGLKLGEASGEMLSQFDWIRVSLQSKAHAEKVAFPHAARFTRVSASYIVSREQDLGVIAELAQFAINYDITLRIAVQRPSTPEREIEVEKAVEPHSPPLFFSRKEGGRPLGCYMAWVRAAIDWRGRFLPCPAMQLNEFSEGKIPESFALCHITGLDKWLDENRPFDLGYRCEFCNCGKEHNDFIHGLMKEVADVDFV